MVATAKTARAMVRRTGRHVRKEASTHLWDIARSMYGRMRVAARDMLRELTAATEPAQMVAKVRLAIAPGVEAAAVTIADMAPPATQAMEIRMRKIARETVLTMLTGVALLALVGATAAVRLGMQL